VSKIPLVAIVGRANVGKSSLFNRLVQTRQAIVAIEAGTTRDAVYGRVETSRGVLGVVDTAGLKAPEDEFEASIQEQITDAAGIADVIVVVVDGTSRLGDEDRRVAKIAHKSRSQVLLVINKADGGKKIDADEFKALDIKNPIFTSSAQNQGIAELMERITKAVSPVTSPDTDQLKIALIGRPNVGKSSLFNSIASKQQAIVADRAGTTRDVNRVRISYHKQEVILLDTAGIRKSGKIVRGIERFSVMRAISAIDESDVCLLVIDATEPGVALDQKLAGVIKEAGKGLILVVTKWDLVDKDAFTHDQLMARLRKEFQHVPWALTIATSAQSGQNVAKLLEMVTAVQTERVKDLKTTQLNKWMASAVAHHPPAGFKRVHPRLRYVTQTGKAPPEITIFGAGVRSMHWSYKRYLERELREAFGLAGTPVVIWLTENEKSKP
jgi:GTP-binding protein